MREPCWTHSGARGGTAARDKVGVHRVKPTPACPERDANGIVAFPVTRGSKLKKVCTTGFTRTIPRQQNRPH